MESDHDGPRKEKVCDLLKTIQQRWQTGRDLAQIIMKYLPAGIIVIDSYGSIQLFNPAAEQLLGHAAEEVVGKNVTLLVPETCRSEYEEYLKQYLYSGKYRALDTSEFELTAMRKDGQTVPVELLVAEMVIGGERYYLAFVHDVQERKKREDRIGYMATHDLITGLLNYHEFAARLAETIERKQPFMLFYVGMDRFRPISEVLGHSIGDQVLQQVGKRLHSMGLDELHMARVADSIFAVMCLKGEKVAPALDIAHSIHGCLEQPLKLEYLSVDIESSIGAACYPEHGEKAESLMRSAEIAMRSARRQQAMCALYNREMEQYQVDNLALASELRHAIEADELMIYYQPKVDIAHKKISGVEALVRWEHPQKGMIQPDLFIPMAEETGIIHVFTTWLLDKVSHQIRCWKDRGIHLTVSVNLAPRNLLEFDLLERLNKPIQNREIPASSLMIEITERGLMVDPLRAIDVLNHIRELGITISIDDFGTGYSSLAYLKDLPVDELKIDQSFIRTIKDDPRSAAIVQMIVQMAQALNIKVIAEGVEAVDEWEYLHQIGCGHAQGYYMGRPMPADELERWLLESPWGVTGGNVM